MAAAATALGRPLASFWTPDDDPSANAADVAFLAARLFAHLQAPIAFVQATYPGAKFELLWPHDVTLGSVYWNTAWPYAQGGRLNRAANYPAGLEARAGSGFDRMKMEALSWGASYRNLDLAKAAIAFPTATPATWPLANIAYLVPIFNGGCPTKSEFLAALNAGFRSSHFGLTTIWDFSAGPGHCLQTRDWRARVSDSLKNLSSKSYSFAMLYGRTPSLLSSIR